MITSTSNKQIKNVIALLSKAKERKKQGLFVVEGIKMFVEAPLHWIDTIYIEEKLFEDIQKGTADAGLCEKIKAISGGQLSGKQSISGGQLSEKQSISGGQPTKNACESAEQSAGKINIEVVQSDVFKKMCDTQTPQGILSLMKVPAYKTEEIFRQKDKGLYLILEDIQDPGNLGTMMRAGEGAGVSALVMSSKTVDLFNPKTIRATMGSIYRVPFVYVDDLATTINRMKEKGISVYAAHLKGEKSYDQFSYKQAVAYMIGNEGNGLTDETAELADAYLKIPMLGEVESLNAAIAATLLVYEAARQRRVN